MFLLLVCRALSDRFSMFRFVWWWRRTIFRLTSNSTSLSSPNSCSNLPSNETEVNQLNYNALPQNMHCSFTIGQDCLYCFVFVQLRLVTKMWSGSWKRTRSSRVAVWEWEEVQLLNREALQLFSRSSSKYDKITAFSTISVTLLESNGRTCTHFRWS